MNIPSINNADTAGARGMPGGKQSTGSVPGAYSEPALGETNFWSIVQISSDATYIPGVCSAYAMPVAYPRHDGLVSGQFLPAAIPGAYLRMPIPNQGQFPAQIVPRTYPQHADPVWDQFSSVCLGGVSAVSPRRTVFAFGLGVPGAYRSGTSRR